jgi:hypothetical protein
MANVGDIYKVGSSTRILVYDMIDSYFFINPEGYQATDKFSSLEEVQLYCDNNHPKNKASEYKDRVYKLVGNIKTMLPDINSAIKQDSINDCFADIAKNLSETGKDKVLHMLASRSLFLIGGDISDDISNDPFQLLMAAFIDALKIGLLKEFNDKGMSKEDFSVFSNRLNQARDQIISIFKEIKEYNLDKGDLYADFIGISFGMLSMSYRGLMYLAKK